MQIPSITAIAVAAVLSFLADAPARADQAGGRLVTRSFTALPASLELAVEPDDNTDTNIALAERMAHELAQRGYAVPERAAPFVLRFDSEIRSNVSSGGARYGREPSGVAGADMSIGAAGPPDRSDDVTNLLSSRGNAVIGERSGEDYSRPLRYVVNARIEDRQSGSILWQGHAAYDSVRTDSHPILEAMVPLLVGEIGRTVRERRFSLE